MTTKPESTVTKKTKKTAIKEKKAGPKRPMSAFFAFMGERRVSLIAEKPELRSNVREVGKIIGDEWKKMSDDTKKTYNERAAKDKERYHAEIAALRTESAEPAATEE